MKQDSIWAITTGILLTLLLVLIVEGAFFPQDVGATMIPIGVFDVFLWLNAYRVSRKKQTE